MSGQIRVNYGAVAELSAIIRKNSAEFEEAINTFARTVQAIPDIGEMIKEAVNDVVADGNKLQRQLARKQALIATKIQQAGERTQQADRDCQKIIYR